MENNTTFRKATQCLYEGTSEQTLRYMDSRCNLISKEMVISDQSTAKAVLAYSNIVNCQGIVVFVLDIYYRIFIGLMANSVPFFAVRYFHVTFKERQYLLL